MKGVLDRIVDGTEAVILVGDDEQEYNYPVHALPSTISVGDHVDVVMKENTIIELKVNPNETIAAKSRITDKMKQLQSRKKSQFKKE